MIQIKKYTVIYIKAYGRNSMKGLFKGSATALITPFDKGKIDYNSMERIREHQISGGTHALVVCGTTGEVSTLSVAERKKLMLYCVEKCAGRIPVILGTGGNNTEACVKMSRYASDIGADGILSVAPYYNKGTKNGIIEHYKRISDACFLPVIAYNVPSRTGVNLTPQDYKRLFDKGCISAVKESNSKPDSWLMTRSICGDALTLYSGNDSDTLPIISLGGRGVISVASNIVPKRISDMCKYALSGNFENAARICLECASLFETLFSEVNPVPIKYAMAKAGLCRNELRLPLTVCENKTAERLDEILTLLGVI